MNKLLNAYRYQVNEYKRPILIYYFISLIVFFLLFSTTIISYSNMDYPQSQITTTSSQFSGAEAFTITFAYISVMVLFKDSFAFIIQNSVSRKTYFISKILTNISITFILAIIDKLVYGMLKFVAMNFFTNLSVSSLFQDIYCDNISNMSLDLHIQSFFYDFSIQLFIISLGLLVSLILRRINKIARILVCVCIPIILSYVFHMLDYVATVGRIRTEITNTINILLGISSHNPIYAMITFSIGFLILSGVSWLLIRRAVLTD